MLKTLVCSALAATACLYSGKALALAPVVDPTLLGAYGDCKVKITGAGLGAIFDRVNSTGHGVRIVPPSSPSEGSGTSASDPSHNLDLRGSNSTIIWNLAEGGKAIDYDTGVSYDNCATLYHELTHAIEENNGNSCEGGTAGCSCVNAAGEDYHIPVSEVDATNAENTYRANVTPRLPARTKYFPSLGTQSFPLPTGGCTARKGIGCTASAGCSVSPNGVGRGASPIQLIDSVTDSLAAWGGSMLGEPHLQTVDGALYDFQASGEFVLTNSTTDNFQVQVRLSNLPYETQYSYISAVAARLGSSRVALYAGDGIRLLVNGNPITFVDGGFALPGEGSILQMSSNGYDILVEDGTEVIVQPLSSYGLNVTVLTPPSRKGAIEGLLGNYDGDPSNDLVIRGGGAIPSSPGFSDLYPRFADSWRVDSPTARTPATSLFDYGAGETTDSFTDRTLPSSEAPTTFDDATTAAARGSCTNSGVTNPASLLMRNCIFDVALSGVPALSSGSGLAQSIGGGVRVSVAAAGGSGFASFSGNTGDRVFLKVPSASLPDSDAALELLLPSGASFSPPVTGSIIGGAGFIDTTVLPVDGTYSVKVSATSRPGFADLFLLHPTDQLRVSSIGGSPTTVLITQSGGVGRVAFAARGGETVYVDATKVSGSIPDHCDPLQLLDPSGRELAAGCFVGGSGSALSLTSPYGNAIVLPPISAPCTSPPTDCYTVVVDPNKSAGYATGVAVGQATISIHR
jgi:hypothetical protein